MPSKSHGMTNTKIYRVWWAMLQRCCNPRVPGYRDYGARGIAVCERWQKFENFFADMGTAPHGKELDRINNDGSYSPQNCRWVTRLEQAQNKRNSRLITLRGKTQSMAAWARELGVNPAAVLYRLNAGWGVKDALTTPKPERPNAKLNIRQARAIRAAYPKLSMDKIAAKYDVSKKTVLNIIHERIFIE